jgi:hypothetical protein
MLLAVNLAVKMVVSATGALGESWLFEIGPCLGDHEKWMPAVKLFPTPSVDAVAVTRYLGARLTI